MTLRPLTPDQHRAAEHRVADEDEAPPRLWILGTLVALLSAGRLVLETITGSRLLTDHPSGTWAALSDDLLHGVLYRPVDSALGWGGTRYPPLHIVLRAVVARTGLGLEVGGMVLDATALLALVVLVTRLLRALGVEASLARGVALLSLAVVPVQTLLGLGKADLVATALSLAGVLLSWRGRPVRAGALFALAVLTKWTVVFGLVASVHDALARGRRRAALMLIAVFGAIVAIGVGLASVASQGRLLAQLRACASGGGTLGERLVQGPLDFLVHSDPADLALVLLAAAALAVARPAVLLPGRLLGWTLAGTIAVFLSPGIAENHLLDLDLAAWIALGVSIGSPALPRRFGVLVLTSLAVLALVRIGPEVVESARNVRLPQLRPDLGTEAEGPLLAENPWLPLMLGERPVLLDAFTFHILASAQPRLGAQLVEDLNRKRFRAVVLRRSPDDHNGRAWYRDVHFGPGFTEALEESYRRVASHPVEPTAIWSTEVWRRR